MARPGGESGSARGALAGAGLILLGACVGIVLGALLDAPRILLRRLQEPVDSVQLAEEPGSPPAVVSGASDLAEYRALQTRAPAPKPAAARAVKPAPKAEPKRAAPARAPAPVVAPPSVAAAPTAVGPRAEDVIDAIAARTPRAAPLPVWKGRAIGPQAGESVVQVGAFPEAGSADRVVERLRRLGFDSYRSEREGSGRSRHRVRVRPGSSGDAQQLAAALRERGFDVWITRE